MQKQHYIAYLVPCRSDFAQTLTETERDIMNRHFEYWMPHLDSGVMMVMGLVFDPAEYYGMGILHVENEEQLIELLAADPASQINHWEYYPTRPHTRMRIVSEALDS